MGTTNLLWLTIISVTVVTICYSVFPCLCASAREQSRLEALATSQHQLQKQSFEREVGLVEIQLQNLEKTLGPRKDWVKPDNLHPEKIRLNMGSSLTDSMFDLKGSMSELKGLLRLVTAGERVVKPYVVDISVPTKEELQGELSHHLESERHRVSIELELDERLSVLNRSLQEIASCHNQEQLNEFKKRTSIVVSQETKP